MISHSASEEAAATATFAGRSGLCPFVTLVPMAVELMEGPNGMSPDITYSGLDEFWFSNRAPILYKPRK